MTTCVLSGGVGAAKLLAALASVSDPRDIIGLVNTGDDLDLHGLRICPDLDTITYTLAGLNNQETGWGLTGETWRVMEELGRLGGESWFSLGDRDLATHLYRTQRLNEGADLTTVTAELTAKLGCPITLLPATHDAAPTRFLSVDGQGLSFQEYFVKHHHDIAIASIDLEAAAQCTLTDAARHALESSARIVIAPSNPLISIGPLLAIPDVKTILSTKRASVVAVSPIVGGVAIKGPSERLMRELGFEASALGVARMYCDLASTMVIDTVDASLAPAIEQLGMQVIVTNTIMDGGPVSAALGTSILDA
jgi:LPPG:FO 2-phospho-L-lactate transferase